MSYYRLIRPILFTLDPERAHSLAILALRMGLAGGDGTADAAELPVHALGLDFSNPLGVAAGFDKNGQVPEALLHRGFGFVEIGTVTPRPQGGNPRPRLFRLGEDDAIINRLGFNNHGLERVRARLEACRRTPRAGIIGVNIGANRDSDDRGGDYLAGIKAFAHVADYLAINISSPNTPGLRDLQERAALDELLCRIEEARGAAGPGPRPPLLIKIAPDLDGRQREAIAEVCLARGVDGLIVANTTLSRPDGLRGKHRGEAGGLSGPPLADAATRLLGDMYRLTAGRLTLIGVGGVASGADAYRMIRAGATLVALYTALVYQGLGLAGRIKQDLAGLLRADGFASVTEAVGTASRDS